jgi:hypothetical protein
LKTLSQHFTFRYSVSYVATKQYKQGSFPVWRDAFDASLRPWQDVTVQFVVPGALHATFYNSSSNQINTLQHVPFSATTPGATQVRYRGYLKFPHSGIWSIHFKECIFSFGFARFQGANISAASVAGGNTTINVSITDISMLYDFVFQCSNFFVNKSQVTYTHTKLPWSAAFQPVLYSGFSVLSKTFLGQGLWATYYDGNFARVAVSHQVISSPIYKPESLIRYSSIRWAGFIQVKFTKAYTFAIRYGGQNTAFMNIDNQMSSTSYSGSISYLFLTIFLYSERLYDIEISMTFGPQSSHNDCMRDRHGLLWVEQSQPEVSLAAQLNSLPPHHLFSSLSSSVVVNNDMLQFSWRWPLNHRIINGAAMARGMGSNRHNTALLVIVNAGSICAGTSSFASSTSLTLLTAGVASSFIFTARDQFANIAETVPIMTLGGIQGSSPGSMILGTVSSLDSQSASTQMQPPITNGLMAYYTADSYDCVTKKWNDLSGFSNHVTELGGPISVVRPAASPAYIQGDTTAWMRFPSTVLPSTYTLFFVARYNGPSRGRIFHGVGQNWLSGFWNSRAGVAHHNCWIASTNYHGDNWVIASDRVNSFRSNGVERTESGKTSCITSVRMAINQQENSHFAIQIILVYNRRLSDSEVVSVENWLSLYSAPSIQEANTNVQLYSPSQVRVLFLPTLSG